MSFERRILLLRKLLLLASLLASIWLGSQGLWLGAAVVVWVGLRRSHALASWRARRALRDPLEFRNEHFETTYPRGWSALGTLEAGRRLTLEPDDDLLVEIHHFDESIRAQPLIDRYLATATEALTVRQRDPVSLSLKACELSGERVIASYWDTVMAVEAFVGPTDEGTLFVTTLRELSLPQELVRPPLRHLRLLPARIAQPGAPE